MQPAPRNSLSKLCMRRTGALACERVEIACQGEVGRTGTALAALAILDDIPATKSVAWVRERYNPQAVETSWQRFWLRAAR
jgi:protein-tyrosine phosphatase